jgi:hypothetical protein
MDIKSQVLEAVLRNYGNPEKELYSSIETITEEEFKNHLKELNLNEINERNLFYWELQAEVEKNVYENREIDDTDRISGIIAEAWNHKNQPKVNSSVIKDFLNRLNLKYQNSRKAFVYICEGDIQSYKAFNNNSIIFIDSLVRYLTCASPSGNMNYGYQVLENIMPKLFENSTKSKNWDAFKRLGFLSKGRLNFGKMSAYKRIIGLENLVFSDGMKDILLEAIYEEELADTLIELKHNLEYQNAKFDKEVESEVEKLLGDDSIKVVTTSKLKTNKEEIIPITKEEEIENYNLVNHPETSNSNKISSDPIVTFGIDELAGGEKELTPQQEILLSLEQALVSVQSAISRVTLLKDEEKVSKAEDFSSTQKLSIAEEEINRLQLALSQERERVALAEEKAYKNILQAIGGESGNYLLSDLFEESQGNIPDNPNISTGRLVNLFSNLSLVIGLEEFSGGHDLGESFTTQKDDLIKNYRIDGPIESQENEIQVKLLKYGWTMNGTVIVQPLVTEVKGEN